MSSLYEEIIKKQYNDSNFKLEELSATDYVNLLCSTNNVTEDTKKILKQALDKLHSKRKQNIEYAIYKKYYDYVKENIEEYALAHKIKSNEVHKIAYYIWSNLPTHIKNDWLYEYKSPKAFRFCKYLEYPYLLHLYNLTMNEVELIYYNYGRCQGNGILGNCLLNNNRCDLCKIHIKGETNMGNIVSKLMKYIKNEYDMNYITKILILNDSARHILLLNRQLCDEYMYNSIYLTGKEVNDDIIYMRLMIKNYMKLHELVRKKIVRRKIKNDK